MFTKKITFKTILFLSLLILINSCSSNATENAIITDTTPPSNIVYTINNLPGNNTNTPIKVSTSLELDIEVTDNIAVTKVAVFIDDKKIAEDVSSPFRFSLDISKFNAGNHRLKITASDEAGNISTTKNRTIVIDNTIPSITNVSINKKSIINGDNNLLTFNVFDDVGVNDVTILLNNISLAKITNEDYKINIKTSNLEDGINTIQIIATDVNDNVSKLEIDFTVDNSAPQIIVNAISEAQTLDGQINFNPEVTDIFSEIASLEILFRGKRIHYIENNTDFTFNFNTESLAAGDGVFKFIVIDKLGNKSELLINTKIARILIRVKLPKNFVASNISESWVFTSKPDGSLLSVVKIERGMTEVILHSTENLSMTDKFMLTFYEIDTNNFNRLSTLQNLSRTSLGTIQIPSRKPNSGNIKKTYNMNGFSFNDVIKSRGTDYDGNKLNNNSFELSTKIPERTNDIYFYTYDKKKPETSYKYQFRNKPNTSNFQLNNTDFEKLNVTSKNFLLKGYFPGVDLSPSLLILGFKNQNDYNHNVFHEVFNGSFTSSQVTTNSPISYPINHSFTKYRNRLTSRNYITERHGKPLSNYSKPNWSVDYGSMYGNTINITTNGTSHTVGRTWLKNSYVSNFNQYSWTLVYDSQQNKTKIIIPELPKKLNHLEFYKYSNGAFWQLKQIEVSGYEGISSYDNYVNKVIKNDKKYFEVSDYSESVYDVTDFRDYPVLLKNLFN